jgi:hypothetical protein
MYKNSTSYFNITVYSKDRLSCVFIYWINFVNAHIILLKMSLCIEHFGAECYAFVTYSVMLDILNSIQVSSLSLSPTNAQQICFKTLQFTLKYITNAPTCFGFD